MRLLAKSSRDTLYGLAAFTMGAGTRGVGFSHQITMILAGNPGQQSPDTGGTTFLSLSDLYPKGQGPFPAKSPANVSGNWAPIG